MRWPDCVASRRSEWWGAGSRHDVPGDALEVPMGHLCNGLVVAVLQRNTCRRGTHWPAGGGGVAQQVMNGFHAGGMATTYFDTA